MKAQEGAYYLTMAAVMLMVLIGFSIMGLASRGDQQSSVVQCSTGVDCACVDVPEGRRCWGQESPRRLLPLIPKDYVGAR